MAGSPSLKKIGVLTGGGDCPGLNAVIRAVAKTAMNEYGLDVYGIEDGYEGLVLNKMRKLSYADVSGILTQGGTILGSSNRGNPFAWPEEDADGKLVKKDRSDDCVKHVCEAGLDALVCIGGDGTLSIAHALNQKGVPCIGVPKTIDNDLFGTDVTFGFDTAVQIVSDALDRLHSTAQAHHRVMVVETMGRYAGWLALVGGISGGGDIILIPEIPYEIEHVCRRVRDRNSCGKRFSIVVISEGVITPKGDMVVRETVEESHDPVRLGGIGMWLARRIQDETDISSRAVVLGHLQRGGTPTAYDRVLATRFGTEAMQLLVQGVSGVMVGLRGTMIEPVPLTEVADRQRLVTPDSHYVEVARSVGATFGDR